MCIETRWRLQAQLLGDNARRKTYAQTLAHLFGGSLVRHFPLLDGPEDLSIYGDDGTDVAVTFGQAGPREHTCAAFDGATSYISIYSASLQAQFNRLEGSVMAWIQITDPAVWTDGNLRVAVELRTDGNNAMHIAKDTTNNQIQCAYIAGGTSRTKNWTVGDDAWHQIWVTFSDSQNEWRAYLDCQLGTGLPQDIGTWVGALDANTNNIGAYNDTPILAFAGNISDVLIINRPVTAAEIAKSWFIWHDFNGIG